MVDRIRSIIRTNLRNGINVIGAPRTYIVHIAVDAVNRLTDGSTSVGAKRGDRIDFCCAVWREVTGQAGDGNEQECHRGDRYSSAVG